MCSITGIGHETKLCVCREAGTIVRWNTKFRDMNVHVPAHDERAIEVLASLVVSHQLAMDIKRSDCPGPRMSQRIPGELQSSRTLGRTKRRNTASSCPTKAVWWWLPSRPVAGGAANRARLVIGWVPSSGRSSALAWIRFPILARKVDQDVVSVLREGFFDIVGFFSGRRLLTGKTGLRPIWSNSFST